MLDNIKAEIPTDKIYEDALQPSAKAVGTLVSYPFRIVRSLLSPLEKWILLKEQNIDKITASISEKLETVDPSKIITPEPYIAVPALQAISYCMDSDELRDVYANLLAKAMNKDTAKGVHPAFTEIIKQLSPLEAMLLKQNKLNAILLCDLRLQKKSNLTGFPENLKKLPDSKFRQEGLDLYTNLSCLKIAEYTEDEITTAVENLERLGIFLIKSNTLIHQDYSLFQQSDTYINHKKNVEFYKDLALSENTLMDQKSREQYRSYEFVAITKHASVTNLGKAFIEICVL